jgi:hypothetical protein
MNRATVIGAGLLLVAGVAGGLAWRFLLKTPALESSSVIPSSQIHAYQYIAAPGLSWAAANTAAATLSWKGQQGYLATIDSADEYQFVLDHVFPRTYPDVTYLGGRQTAPGEWRWVTGPDGAHDGGKGRLFWRGDEQGAIQDGLYANWMSTAFQHGGKWDIARVCCVSLFSYGVPQFSTSLGTGNSEEHVAGYLVEFGS